MQKLSTAVCSVQAVDYAVYWEGKGAAPEPTAWNGIERRCGVTDRRSAQHERRWEKAKGRRFRSSDRRTK